MFFRQVFVEITWDLSKHLNRFWLAPNRSRLWLVPKTHCKNFELELDLFLLFLPIIFAAIVFDPKGYETFVTHSAYFQSVLPVQRFAASRLDPVNFVTGPLPPKMTSLIRVTDVDTNQIKPFMPTDLFLGTYSCVSCIIDGIRLHKLLGHPVRIRRSLPLGAPQLYIPSSTTWRQGALFESFIGPSSALPVSLHRVSSPTSTFVPSNISTKVHHLPLADSGMLSPFCYLFRLPTRTLFYMMINYHDGQHKATRWY
ncbi:hypothetical protein BKA65DRAFT_538107 [Rhexocercosporidium sp. MPI-PUGE-AT-0058]|nr:hypothetical protein BKA65DRAFT_538107 [Rhexocercosporidium sp. MPI-PUGE-AT-0058]